MSKNKEQAAKEALEKFPVVMTATGTKGISYDPNYPNRKNFEEKRLLQLELTQAQATIERQAKAIETLTEQRDSHFYWYLEAMWSSVGNFTKEYYEKKMKEQAVRDNAIIEAILNGESK